MSGPDGSSIKRSSRCAAGLPGRSRLPYIPPGSALPRNGCAASKSAMEQVHRAFAYFPHMPYDIFLSQEGKPMLPEEITFFEKMPSMLSVYQALRDQLVKRCPELQIKVSKTQISFRNRHIFAMASLPFRRAKGWPECCLIVSFGLCCRLDSPRIVQAVEPYPNRWTHHVLVTQCAEIDAELLAWLDEAYRFAMAK